MALMMVAQGLTRAQVEDPAVEVAFPESVVDMMKGNLGQPPGGWPKALQQKVLKGEPASTERPGAVMPPADLAKLRAEAGKLAPRGRDDRRRGLQRLPDVSQGLRRLLQPPPRLRPGAHAADAGLFLRHAAGAGDLGRDRPGKTLEVRLQAVGETNAEGDVRVFFELNGQPRTVRVPNRKAQATRAEAAEGRGRQPEPVAAPMPGVIASVAVADGQPVQAGDLMLTIEAMKMETGLYADRAGTVKALHVQPGAQVDAKDLLVELAPA